MSVVGAHWNPKANGKQLGLFILSCGICFWLWMNLGGLLRAQSWIVQSWFKISQNNAKLEIKYESLKSQFSWINFVYNLIIGCAKKNRENYQGDYIWTKETRTHNKNYPWVNANHSSNKFFEINVLVKSMQNRNVKDTCAFEC